MDSGAFHISVEIRDHGKRLDVLMAEQLGGCSRSTAVRLIQAGRVKVDAVVRKAGYRVKAGERVAGFIPPPVLIDTVVPENIPIEILYEDAAIAVVNKPPGLVVHPAPGHLSGTLVNALLYHCPDIAGVGGERRPGIVHRLDKDTSGVMVVAKHQRAHEMLSAAFQARQVQKVYRAVVYGRLLPASGTITAPIGRHPMDRKRMCVQPQAGRTAETHWRVVAASGPLAEIEVVLKTGRTHQIRVHMEHLGAPLVGDPVYTRYTPRASGMGQEWATLVRGIRRQMLHASRLAFTHPETNNKMTFHAALPEDMQSVLTQLKNRVKTFDKVNEI
ncbi:MAG: RNA pseudouridine synthase [Deltaproteobacteria bacterium]|nr:MAG: RNA pseudouridine synthase [Deltaproteobacteria bacterium]